MTSIILPDLRRFSTLLRGPGRSASLSRDPLTGLPDRSAFGWELDARLRSLSKGGTNFALAMIDLARFKNVNDAHGHATGDALLSAVACRFNALLRPGEFVARLGGDEFVAIIPLDDDIGPEPAVARLRIAVDPPFAFGSFAVTCGAGIGVVISPKDGTDAHELLERADFAMYRAKRTDPAGTCYFCPALDDAQRLRRDLGTHLRAAIESGQIGLTFVPRYALRGATVLGCEALPYWDHPTLGTFPSEMLLDLAEENAAALPLGGWMLREACSAAAGWPEPINTSVNVSPLLLTDPALPDIVAEALEESGLPPSGLSLELTEMGLLHDRDRVLRRLHNLRSLGVGLILDEYGVAPCSLDALRAFPFDHVKLHSTVLEADPLDPTRPLPLLSGLVSFCRLFGIPVTAMGADTMEYLEIALGAGCDGIQGLAADKVSNVLAARIPRPAPTLALRDYTKAPAI